MNQFEEISGSFPDADGAEDLQEELEEALEFTAKGGGELFGEPTIHPSFYHCSTHGDILAQDVVWGPDDLPHCPEAGCEETLTKKSGAD